MSYCKNCRTSLEEGINFCPNCGMQVIKPSEQPYDYRGERFKNAAEPKSDQGLYIDMADINRYYPNPYVNPTVNASQYRKPDINSYANQASNPGGDKNVKHQVKHDQAVTDHLYESPRTFQNIQEYSGQGKAKRGINAGFIIGIMAAVVFTLIIWFAVSAALAKLQTPSYEKPVENMFLAIEQGDYEKYINSLPVYMRNTYPNYSDNSDAAVANPMDTVLAGMRSTYGDDLKITYQITDKMQLNEAQLLEMESEAANRYGENINIAAAYTLGIEATVKGSKSEDSTTDELTVVLIDSKWYVALDIF